MQEITDKDFDNKFRQAFEEMEVAPPKNLFAKIEEEIHQKKSKHIPFYLAAASIAAILAIGFIWKMQSSTEIYNPKIANNISQKIENTQNISPTKMGQSGTSLMAKANGENRINKVEEGSIKNNHSTSNTKFYYEKVAKIKKQEPKISEGENIEIQQNISKVKLENESIALTQVKEENLSTTVEHTDKQVALQITEAIPKATDSKTLVMNNDEVNVPYQSEKNKLISGLFKNLKQKVTDITSEVVSSDNNSTTLNLGFVAITKYKN